MNRKLTKRIISSLLALVLLLSNVPATAFATEETGATQPADETVESAEASRAVQTDLKAAIEQQIRTYAKSINKSNADDAAATAIAKHGITGGGKTLAVGKNHALTATLMNSELGLATVIRGCELGIKQMQQLNLSEAFVLSGTYWGTDPLHFFNIIYPETPDENTPGSTLQICHADEKNYTGKTNGYDSSLGWIAGSANIRTTITKKSVTADTVTYNVTVSFEDRFDFSTSSNSGFQNLISGLGALLFKEFNWTATATFSLTVDNGCSHDSSAYYWRYDAGTQNMTSVTTDEFGENQTKKYTVTKNGGSVFYYELDRMVTLLHNVPWELEYTVKKPGYFILSPTPDSQNACYEMAIYYRTHFFIQNTERIESIYKTHCYGYTFANLFNYAKDQLFTVRLENVMQADGSNMIYVSVYNHDLQKTVLEPLPMDDYYWIQSGVQTLQDDESRGLSGEDLRIKYIGNAKYPFTSEIFELKVWENGKNGESDSCFTDKVTKPTCAAKGYTTRTCSLCGYSYKTAYTNKLSHTYTPAVTPPTCTEQGYTIYTCGKCGDQYTDHLEEALGHRYGEWSQTVAPTCTATGEESRSCAICKKSEIKAVTALGHDTVQHPGLTPTCTEDGWGDYESCNRCDYSTYQAISAKGHDYGSEVTPPTCTEDGCTTHTCAACGDTYVDTYVDKLGHTDVIDEPIAATCTESGLTEGKHCTVCGEILIAQEEIPALGHSKLIDEAVAPTCTETGLTEGARCTTCGEVLAQQEVIAALGHSWTDPSAVIKNCGRCGHTEGGYRILLNADEFSATGCVWIDGVEYAVTAANGNYYVDLEHTNATNLVVYTYHDPDAEDIHTQYPTGMKVWLLKHQDGTYTAQYVKEFDNLLQYSGSSIRITGKKGIRMITSIAKDKKTALTGKGLAGYTLMEYGTVLCFASEIPEGEGLVLGSSYARSNYAYKKNVADPVFASTKDLIQYTNVLVGFSLDQCKDDIAMRPYIILKNAQGEEITLYGGTIYRSIGYIAYQNRSVFQPKTASYNYVWEIIHHVYGDKYDADYRG